MAIPKTRHTVALTPEVSDSISDLANNNVIPGGRANINQTMADLLEIGLLTAERYGGNLSAALASLRTPDQPSRSARRREPAREAS